jgi:RNA polymerase sigma-70 factor (ECF subfamily)
MDMEELYHRYFTAVYKYLFSISQDKHIAEEMTQETFFKAMQKIDGFQGQCDIRVWLCQIGKNAYYDYLRKNKRYSPIEEVPESADHRSMERELEKKEDVYRIHRILHNLQEPYKEVFTLRTFGELSFKEISNLFGKSESWAKMTYLRAKKKIQEAMKHEGNHV